MTLSKQQGTSVRGPWCFACDYACAQGLGLELFLAGLMA